METFQFSPYEMPVAMPQFAGLWRRYDTVLRPDKDEAEWWAGAPSVVRDASGTFWMACRMRTADAPRGLRGYELRILRSSDGIHFEKAHQILRDDVPVQGFERPALLIDPKTGLFKLYACAPIENQGWSIIKFADAAVPTAFEPASAKTVIAAPQPEHERDIRPREFKDPVICHDGARYHAYTIGYIRGTERVFHFVSGDGESWEPAANASDHLLPLAGWHDFFVRPASLVPLGIGWLFVYEGSSTKWYDPVYNIATGLGFTFDLHHVVDLTPEAPLAASATPGPRFATWRYSHWLRVGNELYIYAETACPNETNETRLYRVPLS